VTAAEWFAGGQRIGYDRGSRRVLTQEEAAAAPGSLQVFERVAATEQRADKDTVWLTMLPGFPDGSYGWAQVDRLLGDDLGPRLYVEPVGQGESDKPRDYRYSTIERADLVQALWRHHGVARTVVVTFDYTSLTLLELLRRQLDKTMGSPAITAAFVHNAAGFTVEHRRRHAQRWDLAAIARELGGTVALYVGGSDEDRYEHRQVQATRQRVPEAEILTFPGGHLTTSEHPDLLAAAIRGIAERHGVGSPTAASR
jgi:pimeloyl-ACP methyl ester carboxylesterase